MKIGRARHLAVVVAVGAAVAVTVAASGAMAADGSVSDRNSFQKGLTGYEEDPLVLSTTGNGQVRLLIDEIAQEISYQLSYSDLEGAVQQAHIHLGGTAQSGGISAFLCTNLNNGPAGTPTCPPAPATVAGTIRAADVVGPASQGIAAEEFAELIAAIRSGATYANVHSTKYPGGEIRGQLG